MAILSNINDKFRVDSAGAVYFGTSAGTNGQILKSVGTGGSPVWIPQSDIVGDYLPLAGGQMEGNVTTDAGVTFTIAGNLRTNTNLIVDGTTVLSGTLGVTGVATFGANADVGGNVDVAGGNLKSRTVTGDAYTPAAFNDKPLLTLRNADGNTNYAGIQFSNNSGNYEWFQGAVQTTATRAEYVFQGYDGVSVYKEHLRIKENSDVIFVGLVSGITPTAAANFTTKAYVDALDPKGGPYLPLAGGTLTGNLTVDGNSNLHNILFTAATLPAANIPSINLRNGGNNEFYWQLGPANVLNIVDYDNRNSLMNIAQTGTVIIANPGANIQNAVLYLKTNTTSNNAGLMFINNGATNSFNDIAGIASFVTGGDAKGNLKFWTRNSDGDNTDVTTRMVISSAGVVTVGASKRYVDSASTQFDLEVTEGMAFGGSAFTYATIQGDGAGLGNIEICANAYPANTGAESKITFKTSTSSGGQYPKVLVIKGPNVGIGTDTPAVNLQVEAAGPPTIAQSSSISITSGTRGDLAWYNSSISTVANIRADTDTSATADNVGTDLTFFTRAIGGSLTQKMVIKGGGNVGIGTSNPETTRLNVRGSTNDSSSQIFQAANLGGATKYAIRADGDNKWYKGDNSPSMVLTSTGRVGIGVTAPNAQLDVAGATVNQVGMALFTESSTTAYLTTGFNARPTHTLYGINTTNTYVGTRLSHAGNTEFFHGTVKGASNGEMKYVFQGYNGTAYQEFGYIDCYTTNAGSLIMSGDVVAFSDKKLKKNIKTLDGSKVYKMRGVSFDRIDTGKKSSGVIAQEMQEVAPELVNESGDTLGVAYGNISGYLIEAIKELEARVKILENK